MHTCFTLVLVFDTLACIRTWIPKRRLYTLVLTFSSKVYIFIFSLLFQITCKAVQRTGPCGAGLARLAAPSCRPPAEQCGCQSSKVESFYFQIVISVGKKSTWILEVSLLLNYFFIVNIYILLTRWWRELFFCKNVLSGHIIMPFLCCVSENLEN